ncbi:hypothetical protein DEM27_30835 [Metarhizobium album]|uniref:DUF2628 domain-containing protein n=1 Tax=Metarhizobium album TaxID=2182425 RepID=A0A2U2DGR4_9HYPH|nr:DUF2628 domain-containing protein [Rhizobium album]PWE52458.1 hypothetical protein DEM27_30835 [Rhizobium album]
MASFLVLIPPGGPFADHAGTRFLRDGFSFFGFVLPAIWLFTQRAWVLGLAVLVIQIAALTLMAQDGLAPVVAVVLFAVSLLTALEGVHIQSMLLQHRGWVLDDVVVAETLGDAEDIYFGSLPMTEETARPVAADWSRTSQSSASRTPGGATFGLFDYDGGR